MNDTKIKGMQSTVTLKCKYCDKEYKRLVKNMFKHSLKPGRCGACNRRISGNRMRWFFAKHRARTQKQKRLEKKLINYIMKAKKK